MDSRNVLASSFETMEEIPPVGESGQCPVGGIARSLGRGLDCFDEAFAMTL
jgi:hypothetical protein